MSLNLWPHLIWTSWNSFVPAASCTVRPLLYWPLTPWWSNGFLLLINRIPLNAFAPYKAEEVPGTNSTSSTSVSTIPNKFPNGKLRAGAELSIPSTNCTNLVFAKVAKPLVLIDLKVKLFTFISTPFKFSRPS